MRAGGQLLTEGTDYTVDYNAGTVKILNKSILDAGTPVSCSVESNADYGMQRKTMFGVDFQYDVSKKIPSRRHAHALGRTTPHVEGGHG